MSGRGGTGLCRSHAAVQPMPLALIAEAIYDVLLRQIGQELFISAKTVSVHLSRVLMKLGAANRGEAAAIAHRLRLLSWDE